MTQIKLKFLIEEWENAEDVELIILKGRGRALGSGADIKGKRGRL